MLAQVVIVYLLYTQAMYAPPYLISVSERIQMPAFPPLRSEPQVGPDNTTPSTCVAPFLTIIKFWYPYLLLKYHSTDYNATILLESLIAYLCWWPSVSISNILRKEKLACADRPRFPSRKPRLLKYLAKLMGDYMCAVNKGIHRSWRKISVIQQRNRKYRY